MAFCRNCGNPLPDDAAQCERCGAPVNPNLPQPYIDPSDHTGEFDPADIAANKVFAMAAYLLSAIGVVIALLVAPHSKYVAFHARQALKLQVLIVLVSLLTAFLCWTIVVPIVGAAALVVLVIINLICFFQVCSGKAKDAPLVRSLRFLN